MRTWRRSFVRLRTGQRAASLGELYCECTAPERQLSAEFETRYLAGRGTGDLTPFTGILQGPGILHHAAGIAGSAAGELEPRLTAALRRATAGETDVAVAVSGGIDSWILAAMLLRLGHRVRGYLLVSDVPGYCEREQAMRLAEAVGVPCEEIRVDGAQFREALPDFVALVESPIYNLHPVSKLLLARELAERGVNRIVGGDGADQVMRHDWDCDLLPITLSCFASAGVELTAPFLDDDVVAICGFPEPDKAPVRALARSLNLPAVAKRPTWFPADEPRACLARTTELLVHKLEALRSCAALRG